MLCNECLYHLDQIRLVCVNLVNTNQLQSTGDFLHTLFFSATDDQLMSTPTATVAPAHGKLHLGWASGDFPRAQ